MWASWVNLILGVWLIISAFVWPHLAQAQINTWVLGVIIAGVALVSFAVPMFRWVNALAAVWLFFSTFAVRHETVGTVWNNVIVAIVVFIVAISGSMGVASNRQINRPVST
jgi:ABC-type transport system involved in multi-copper enzyme maturation permease subunit